MSSPLAIQDTFVKIQMHLRARLAHDLIHSAKRHTFSVSYTIYSLPFHTQVSSMSTTATTPAASTTSTATATSSSSDNRDNTKPVWLITGCSQGLGLSLARHALSLGHNVIATSRNPSSTPSLVTEITSTDRGHWLTLDVTSPPEVLSTVVNKALSLYSRIDILINSAAYCVLGPIETTPLSSWHAQMATNLYGPLQLTQLLLPHMRTRRSGTIINISSAQGIIAAPGNGVYAASKFALEALSESLAAEVKDFGIRVALFELGAFRTKFGTMGAEVLLPVESEYAQEGHVVQERLKWIGKLEQLAKGDPDKAAEVICEVALGNETVRDPENGPRLLRFVLGEDCWVGTSRKIDELRRTWDLQRELCKRTAVDE